MTSPTPSNFPSQVWCVQKNKEATKAFSALQKRTQIQSDYGWVYFVGNKSGDCRTSMTILPQLTTVQKCLLLNAYYCICRLASYAPHVLIVVALGFQVFMK